MIKVTLFLLGMLHLSLYSMEDNEKLKAWRTQKLQTLLDESKSPTYTQYEIKIRELKIKFAHRYLDTYNEQQEILHNLLRETNGVIGSTTDPELAEENPNKFLCLDPLQSTADEIDARWLRIQNIASKNMGSCVVTTQN